MERVDVMVDIETLGNKIDSSIIQIGAIAFDITTGKHISTFESNIDVLMYNESLNITSSTLKWWLKTDSKLLLDLLERGNENINVALYRFSEWIEQFSTDYDNKNIFLWGNGILFDNKILEYNFNKHLDRYGLKYPIFYRNDRDVRTIVDLASKKMNISEKDLRNKFEGDKLVKHNALDDVKYQIDLVVGCYNLLINK